MHRPLILFFGVLTTGCSSVLSLSPVVSASAAVADDRLLGDWIADDSSPQRMRVTVTRREDRSYQMKVIDGKDSSIAIARLMPLGQRLLMDLSPAEESVKTIERANGIPLHWQVILELSDSLIRATALNADTLRRRHVSGTGPALAVAYPPGGDVLLTDSTARLAAGLARYLSNSGVVHQWTTYRRPVAQSEHKSSKGMLYGAVIGGAVGATIGAATADPDPRELFSGWEYGALGGGLLGAVAGAIVGGIVGALRQ